MININQTQRAKRSHHTHYMTLKDSMSMCQAIGKAIRGWIVHGCRGNGAILNSSKIKTTQL